MYVSVRVLVRLRLYVCMYVFMYVCDLNKSCSAAILDNQMLSILWDLINNYKPTTKSIVEFIFIHRTNKLTYIHPNLFPQSGARNIEINSQVRVGLCHVLYHRDVKRDDVAVNGDKNGLLVHIHFQLTRGHV